MAADAPSPRPTAEESAASAENSEIQNDATKSAAVADKSDVVDAVVAEAEVGEKEKEGEKEAKTNDDTTNAAAEEGDNAAGEASKTDGDEQKEGEDKGNAAAAEPEADTEEVSALDGSADVKKPKKKSPATTAKSTPKSASKKKSLANLRNNGTPAKAKNADVNYEPGMQVLAKMRTFPPWPAVILSEELLPEALIKTRPSNKHPRTKGSSAEPAETKRHWPVMYMGTNEYSWMPITNLDPLTAEILATPPTNIKSKGLLDAYQVAQEGFGLEQVKKLQASEVMDVDTAEEDAAEEDAAEEEAESMEVDDPESEAEKKPKKASSKKRKISTSDEDPETSEKPSKTPKKAAAKAKTPKTKAAKTPKTPKTPANGTAAKAAAKPKASTVKKEKAAPAPKSAKKKTPARSSKAKSAEKIDESDSEREEASSEVTKEEEKDPAEFQMKQVKALRGRLQRGFLTKDTPPVEKDMADMASKFDVLENLQNHGIDAEIIKSTKINKVLKGIIKLPSVPLDDKYNFKKRSTDLLAKMNIVLASADGAAPATEKTLAVGKEKDIKKATEKKNGVKAGDADQDKEEEKSEEKTEDNNDEDAATSKKEDVEMRDTDDKTAEKEETANELPEQDAVRAST